ncbi:HCLS1-associated protein X-1-like isoform X1 [Haliotis rufescens]|uniref:HCLS1-associated protein X-1-like isoform X1 n=1 Tax=Haliotis rufescens TaxID=6454 RepID=UPI00201EC5E9|nr:HCLS1-associated protein X-1-like isoform X1 [Haliotis rufescens]
MDPRDLFRGIFGFNRHRFDGSERNRNDRFFDDDDDDFAEYDDGTDTDHMFHHFHDEMQKQMDSLNQQMEEMFKQFGAVDFPSVLPGEPSGPAVTQKPRDKMLKPGQSEGSPASPSLEDQPRLDAPSLFRRFFTVPRFGQIQQEEKVDKDLDNDVEGKDLSKILSPMQPERRGMFPHGPGIFSHHGSVSITTIRGADGKLEQRKTVIDSDGNEETTVTRQVGDKSHTIRTKKDEFGVVEENQTMKNIDKDDLTSFDEQWQNKGRQPTDPRDTMVIPKSDSDETRSIFRNLFGFDLSGKKN